MRPRYRNVQIGNALIVILGAGIIILANLLNAYGFRASIFVILVVLLAALALLHSLTVEVDDRSVLASFGPGLVRRRIPLDAIAEVRVERAPWYYGYGIRWTPMGWTFRVSGSHVVQLVLRDGRRFCIGTPEPEVLARAVDDARGGPA
ncbi:MAG: hypothetical protein PHN82_05615 [bacterium]|nr:hypothetical protein [bacterium]